MSQEQEFDTIVVGGGTAGVIAALQSARAGVRTLLIEKGGMLGGTTTTAGINAPAHFFAWGHQVVGGIGYELICKTFAEEGRNVEELMEDYRLSTESEKGLSKHLRIHSPLYSLIVEEALTEANCERLFHTLVAGASFHSDQWHLQVCGKEGLFELQTKCLIDCTGDANLCSIAGYTTVGREELQPATYSCQISGYDFDTVDIQALNQALCQAIDQGEVEKTDLTWEIEKPSLWRYLKWAGVNGNHLQGDGRTSAGRSQIEIDGRASVLRAYRFLKKQPGFEQLKLDMIYTEAGVRETVVIDGETTVTLADYESGRVFDDAIAYCYYPVDLHLYAASNNCYRLKFGTVPTIPRSALVPRDSQNLMVAGRCISSDQLANSGLREQSGCMAMGQAAGAIAALASRLQCPMSEVPHSKIRDLLELHGAILPPQQAT